MSKEMNLPAWAKLVGPSRIEVDASLFYPEILKDLEVDEAKVSQYWLAVVRAIMKMDVRVAVAGTGDAAPVNGVLTILVNDTTKVGGVSKWAESAYQRGEGAAAGAKAAKGIFGKLRGVIPA